MTFPATRQQFRQLAWFTIIGIVMTAAYLALYQLLRGHIGAQPANIVAWVVTAIADTSANRRVTFGIAGRDGAARAQVEGLLVFAVGLGLTSGALAILSLATANPGALLEVTILAAANLAAGLLRFVLLRVWVFRPGRLSSPMAFPYPGRRFPGSRPSRIPHSGSTAASTP